MSSNPTSLLWPDIWKMMATGEEISPGQFAGISGGLNCEVKPVKGDHYCSFENSTWYKLGILLISNAVFLSVIVGIGIIIAITKAILDEVVGYDALKQVTDETNAALGSAFPYLGEF